MLYLSSFQHGNLILPQCLACVTMFTCAWCVCTRDKKINRTVVLSLYSGWNALGALLDTASCTVENRSSFVVLTVQTWPQCLDYQRPHKSHAGEAKLAFRSNRQSCWTMKVKTRSSDEVVHEGLGGGRLISKVSSDLCEKGGKKPVVGSSQRQPVWSHTFKWATTRKKANTVSKKTNEQPSCEKIRSSSQGSGLQTCISHTSTQVISVRVTLPGSWAAAISSLKSLSVLKNPKSDSFSHSENINRLISDLRGKKSEELGSLELSPAPFTSTSFTF